MNKEFKLLLFRPDVVFLISTNQEPQVEDYVLFKNGQFYISQVKEKVGGSPRDIVLHQMPAGREKGTLDYREMFTIVAGMTRKKGLWISPDVEKQIGYVNLNRMSYDYLMSVGDNTINTSWQRHTQNIFIQGYRSNPNHYTKDDMIRAAKYGYEFRHTTSFPDQSFEESCINNFKQFLQSNYEFPKFYEVEEMSDEGDVIKITKVK